MKKSLICIFFITILSIFSNDYILAKDRVHIITVSTYGSDAIILESNGKFAMIDTGEDLNYPDGSNPLYPFRKGTTTNPDASTEDRLFNKIKQLGIKEFEFIIITHTHSDHIGGAYNVLKNIPTKKVYLKRYTDERISDKNRLWDNLYNYDRTIEMAKRTGAQLLQDISTEEAEITLGNMNIHLLNYENEYENGRLKEYYDDNFNSILSVIEVNNKKLFFGGDLQNDFGAEDRFAPMIGKVDFMKFNHHVETTHSNAQSFLNVLNPKYMIKTSDAPIYDESFLSYIKDKDIKIITAGRKDVDSLTFEIRNDDIYDLTSENVRNGFYREDGILKFKDWKGDFNKEGLSYQFYDWYYFNADGSVAVNWKYIDNDWYFFDSEGKMKTSAWQGDYYFDKNGRMLRDTTTPDGYVLDNDGKWIGKWYEDSKGKYFKNSNGKYLKSHWLFTDGKWYYFDKDGYAVTGWKHIIGEWYYFDENGIMQKMKWAGNYYLSESGVMLRDTKTPDGFYVDKNGKWYEPWKKNSIGKWFVLSDGNYHRNKWALIEDFWYYFDKDGYAVTEWKYINKKWYFFNSEAQMQSNSWIGNYYVGENGEMLVNTTTPDGKKVDENGKLISDYNGETFLDNTKREVNKDSEEVDFEKSNNENSTDIKDNEDNKNEK